MVLEIKKRIEKELKNYLSELPRLYSLKDISALLYKNISEFALRPGKRVRPTLFCLGYLGFAAKEAPGLFRSAVSIELLHDFLLVHDDIIDKSATRRGKPSMHTLFNRHISGQKKIKFSGEDLAIVTGDIMYAMALDAFLAVKEKPERKEMALRKLIQAGLYTGSGEFIELVCGLKDIAKIKKEDIYKIYDLKTANYTFSSPLCIGATLAGAKKREVDILSGYGLLMGRAFQIKDDIIGIFSEEKKIGKSNLTDLQESKKTLLIWYAYHHCPKKDRQALKKILLKTKVSTVDLLRVRALILGSGALDYAKVQIKELQNRADSLLNKSSMKSGYKELLRRHCANILAV